ncbi:MAG: YeeE/YedE thiosulfate transporter family protein [Acidobacteria bacterium]|nr:YeeE/YedE thiosulfate transporter family protein [Acidobacteriota bacterium]
MNPAAQPTHSAPLTERLFPYLLVGALFGIMLTKSEVVSWFRIQEMFRFQSFHMYGIIGLAVLTAAISLFAIRIFSLRSLGGEPIDLPTKVMGPVRPNHLLGGIAFGLGWGLVGACPGPIYALIGSGVTVMIVALASALAGAWTYGLLRSRLPH